MGRKNLLSGLMDDLGPPGQSVQSTEPERTSPTFGIRGAVGAMSRSLEKLSAENHAAKALAERFASGETVVEIDPSLIDASIVPDRMPGTEADHTALVRSIEESGQLVPVLLRPHPRDPSRFQTAYGHRRVRALSELKRPVRAIVRKLTDDELVVAQGKENGERRDLSFIERASYAVALEESGFKRDTIGLALSVDKTELSRLIGVARAIPRSLVNAIGPAPKVGRRRWMELEVLLQGRDAAAGLAELLMSHPFLASDSDARFASVCAALSPRREKARATIWTAEDGLRVASIDRRPERTMLAVDEKAAPGFGEYVVERLAELYSDYQRTRG